MADDTVVPKPQPLDEAEFHAAMLVDLTKLSQRHGRPKVAQTLGVSLRQLDNILAGAFPRADRLHNLRALDPDALDAIDRAYGDRRVPRGAVCSTDPVSTRLARLLTQTIEMESPDSDGGSTILLAEVLELDEDTLRKAAHTLVGWVERIDAYRAGEKPKLRVANS